MSTAFDTYFNSPALLVNQLKALGAELVTIRQAGQVERQVWGIVKRFAPGAVDNRSGVPVAKATLTVVADASVGLLPSQANNAGATKAVIPWPDTKSETRELSIFPPADNRTTDDGGLARFDIK
jgi:hypothetical protein